jgi:hypothetical protein
MMTWLTAQPHKCSLSPSTNIQDKDNLIDCVQAVCLGMQCLDQWSGDAVMLLILRARAIQATEFDSTAVRSQFAP